MQPQQREAGSHKASNARAPLVSDDMTAQKNPSWLKQLPRAGQRHNPATWNAVQRDMRL